MADVGGPMCCASAGLLTLTSTAAARAVGLRVRFDPLDPFLRDDLEGLFSS